MGVSMRISPRQHLLQLWESYAAAVRPDGGEWRRGGRGGANSVTDAEQLLVLLYPAAEVAGFALDDPDRIEDDVLGVLANLGDVRTIPRLIIGQLAEFLERNTGPDGEPVFTAGSRLIPDRAGADVTPRQLELEVVESYSISLTLCLAAAGFTKVFSASVSRPELRERIRAVDAAIDKRLTAAMVGLLRSFTLHAVRPGSVEQDHLMSMLNQGRAPDRYLLARLHRRLEGVRAKLPELTIGLAQNVDLFYDNPDQLFELGWTWGVADDAPPVELAPAIAYPQAGGHAVSRPSLYFTARALDGLGDLFSDRTLRLGLISADQQHLAKALELRWNLTQQYWSTIARFGEERWPLEDVPWLTTDGEESVYNSLLVFSILRRDRISRRITDDELTRAVAVLEELAVRGRVTRRMTRDDDALSLHTPGVQIRLPGSESLGGPALSWYAADFAAGLGKSAVEAATLSGQPAARERLFAVAEAAMENLWRRRITNGPDKGLWDDLRGAYPNAPKAPSALAAPDLGPDAADWTLTERVMEFLVATAAAYERNPLRTQRLYEDALGLLAEAEHKLGRELQVVVVHGGPLHDLLIRIQDDIRRARRLAPTEPGTACGVLYETLRRLEELSEARRDATGNW